MATKTVCGTRDDSKNNSQATSPGCEELAGKQDEEHCANNGYGDPVAKVNELHDKIETLKAEIAELSIDLSEAES